MDSIDEPISLVNDSRFGLQAVIYTENVNTALHAAEKLHVGGVLINDIPTFGSIICRMAVSKKVESDEKESSTPLKK